MVSTNIHYRIRVVVVHWGQHKPLLLGSTITSGGAANTIGSGTVTVTPGGGGGGGTAVAEIGMVKDKIIVVKSIIILILPLLFQRDLLIFTLGSFSIEIFRCSPFLKT
jgi:hypothetical protein